MAFYFKNSKMTNDVVPVLPSNTTTLYVPTTTDIGCLIALSSNLGKVFASTASPETLLGTVNGLYGILQKVASTGSTHGSTIPFYVSPIHVGDVVVADYSTAYAGTSNFVLVSSNVGSYFKPCHTTGTTSVGTEALVAAYTEYINPSTYGTVPCSSEMLIFKLMDFSTNSKQATFIVQTS